MTQVAADRIDRIIADYERGALNDASARLEILLAAGEGDVEALLARLTHELREWVFRDVGEARPNEGEIIESHCGTASPGADETDLRSREEVLQRGIIAVRSVAARRRIT